MVRERINRLSSMSLEKRRLYAEMIFTFKCKAGLCCLCLLELRLSLVRNCKFYIELVENFLMCILNTLKEIYQG